MLVSSAVVCAYRCLDKRIVRLPESRDNSTRGWRDHESPKVTIIVNEEVDCATKLDVYIHT